MTRRTQPLARRFALVLCLPLLLLVGCDGDDLFYDDDPVASGRWSDEIVDDAGAGGFVELDFDGIFDPGDYSNDQIEIEVRLDSGRDAIDFELSDRAGWSYRERLGTIDFRAEYSLSADRMRVDAVLESPDDRPVEMEARVRYRVRLFGSSGGTRFDREYTWREVVEF